MERVRANGVDFAYLEAGPADGPLVLCLHGFPDHAPTYRGLLECLAAEGYHAVAPWMRGYAPTSSPEDGAYQTAALALDALALCESLSPDRPATLVGHDWGASAVYLAATLDPGRVDRVVAMAVPPTQALAQRFLFDPEQLKRSWYIFFFQLPLAEVAVSADDFAFIDVLWRDWSPGYEVPAGYMRELKDCLAVSLEPALGYYRAMFDPSRHRADLEAAQGKASDPVPVPTLYLHGTEDGCLGPGLVHPEELEPHFPAGLEVEMVDGTGHFLHLERPDFVHERILRFLRV